MTQPIQWPKIDNCDAEHPSIYINYDGEYVCRCLVCSRCERHTGNNTQGHYWKICKVQLRLHSTTHKIAEFIPCDECMPEFHFCCNDNCELFNEDGTNK